ncbi:MAG: hypothetical protein Q9215_000384 [Flavoplaca cf. flavocitrina]
MVVVAASSGPEGLELPFSVRKVDVVGSWDNFKAAYPLEKDRQAGPGHWRGCHSFENITCDGLSLDPAMRRNGALKMGGTYWYFYRLNGDNEYHDPVEPSTTACPLLPGQEVNILEVPIESQVYPSEVWETDVFTLDPDAKYNPRKPPPRPKPTPVPSDTLSVDSVHPALPMLERQRAYIGTSAPPPTAILQPPGNESPKTGQALCIPFPSSSFLMAKIFKLRNSKSASEVDGKMSGPRRAPFKSFWRRSTEDNARRQSSQEMPTIPIESQSPMALGSPRWDSCERPPMFAPAAYGAPWTADSATDHAPAASPFHSIASQRTVGSELQSASQIFYEGIVDDSSMRRTEARSKSSSPCSFHTGANNELERRNILGVPGSTSAAAAPTVLASLKGREPYGASFSRPDESTRPTTAKTREGSPHILPIRRSAPPVGLSEAVNPQPGPVTAMARSTRPPSLLYDNRHTLESFYLAGPLLDGQLSPHYLSQPETPSARDFEEGWESGSQSRLASQSTPQESPPIGGADLESLPMPQLSSPGFQGYSLPEADHMSNLTLRKLPSKNYTDSQQLSPSTESRHFVQSWDDGSDQRHLTALDELVDDLGHLGRIIT